MSGSAFSPTTTIPRPSSIRLSPIAAYLYTNAPRDQPRLALMALLVFYAMIIVGLVMTASRSALALGGLSWALTYFFSFAVCSTEPPARARRPGPWRQAHC